MRVVACEQTDHCLIEPVLFSVKSLVSSCCYASCSVVDELRVRRSCDGTTRAEPTKVKRLARYVAVQARATPTT